jgi:hypothetical protein
MKNGMNMLGGSPSTLNCIEKILKVEHVKAFFSIVIRCSMLLKNDMSIELYNKLRLN